MRKSSMVHLLVLVGLTATTALASNELASADDSVPRSSVPPQHSVANQVEDLAATTDEFADRPGYAGVSIDVANRTVVVSWKGSVPERLQAMEGLDPNGIRLEVTPVKMSAGDIDAAAAALFNARGSDLPPVVRVAPNEDFSGLQVGVGVAPNERPTERTRSGLQAVTQIPIDSVAPVAQLIPRSRVNDADPWQGGGFYSSSTEYCTVGFPVLDGANGRLLSAGHCDMSGNSVMHDGAGQTLSIGGAAVTRHLTNDSLLIDPVGGTIGKVFGGPWNAGTSHVRYQFKVVAKSLPKVGTLVCISGAMTGEHCNARIAQTSVVVDCGNPGPELCHGFEAESTDGGIIDGAGDSGAPVYFDRGDGTVGARGMLAGGVGGFATGCPSNTHFALSYGECDTRAMVIGYQFLEADWGVVIEVE